MTEQGTPEATLVKALANGEPIPADLVEACNVLRLADMAVEQIGRPAALVPALHLPRLASEFSEPWPPPPLNDPDATPAVVLALAIARGERADRLAETTDPVAMAWFVLQVREWPPSSRPIELLELFERSEWGRLQDQNAT